MTVKLAPFIARHQTDLLAGIMFVNAAMSAALPAPVGPFMMGFLTCAGCAMLAYRFMVNLAMRPHDARLRRELAAMCDQVSEANRTSLRNHRLLMRLLHRIKHGRRLVDTRRRFVRRRVGA